MATRKNYKQIVITEISDNICIFHIAESKFKEEELYIMGIAQFVEYAEYYRPRFVIIDRIKHPIKITNAITAYIRKYGIENLYRIGVKKVFKIMDKDSMDKNMTDMLSEVQSFESIDECLKTIGEKYSQGKAIL